MPVDFLDRIGDFTPHLPAVSSGGSGTVLSVTAGAGQTDSGTATDPVLNVIANADGSITVNANDILVGVLATDAQHGVRGGGTQHAAAIAAGASGFMTGTDKTKLDGVATSAAAVGATAGADVTLTAGGAGAAATAARSDHTHALDVSISPTWTGTHVFQTTDAGTNTIVRRIMRHLTSGTAAAGLGVGHQYDIEDDAGGTVEAGRVDILWTDAATASTDSATVWTNRIAGTLTETMRLNGATTQLEVKPDTDAVVLLGRLRIDARTTDIVHLSHVDITAANAQMIRQNASGTVIVSCPSGQSVNLASNGVTKIRAGSTGIAFFAGSEAAQQDTGVVTTNNITAGGTNDTFADYSIAIPAYDAATAGAIRDNLHQLARKVKLLDDALRAFNLVN